MKGLFFFTNLLTVVVLSSCSAQEDTASVQPTAPDGKTKYNKLTEQEAYVILHKGTDRAFTGDYYNKKDQGMYICRQCNNPLYNSADKFESHCGWPSFDDEIEGAVIRKPDADGMRTEIICANCNGHLGHVFEGEGFTDKDVRHCVNTSSLLFIPAKKMKNLPEVIKP